LPMASTIGLQMRMICSTRRQYSTSMTDFIAASETGVKPLVLFRASGRVQIRRSAVLVEKN
jgi:hypothetical protein